MAELHLRLRSRARLASRPLILRGDFLPAGRAELSNDHREERSAAAGLWEHEEVGTVLEQGGAARR